MVRVNTGMQGVVPVQVLDNLLMRDDLVALRERAQDDYLRKQQPPAAALAEAVPPLDA
jgi:hypothetical protein